MPISSGRSVGVESWIWFRGKVQLLQLLRYAKRGKACMSLQPLGPKIKRLVIKSGPNPLIFGVTAAPL